MTALGLAAALPFNQTKGDPLLSLGPVFAIRAKDSIPGEQWALNKGTAGQVLRARYGSVGRAEIRRGVGLALPGATGNNASIATSPQATTSLSIRCELTLDSWIPAVQNNPLAKWGTGAGDRQFLFGIDNSTGRLVLYLSTDGSTTASTSTSTVSPTPTASGRLGLRADWDVSGTVKFYTKDCNGLLSELVSDSNWVQLGSDRTGAASTALWASTTQLRFGSHSGSSYTSGILHTSHVRVDGTIIASVDFTNQTDLTTSFTCTTGQTVTVTAVNAVDSADPTLLKNSSTNFIYYADCGAVSPCNAATSPAVSYNTTGDVEWIVQTIGIDWSNSTRRSIVSSWPTGFLFDRFNGTALLVGNGNSTSNCYATPAHGLTGVQDQWFRIRYIKSTGTWNVAKSSDGSTWTDITSATNTPSPGVNQPNFIVPVSVGGSTSLGSIGARVPFVEMRNGISGSALFRYDERNITNWTNLSSWTSSTGEVWTIQRAAAGNKTVVVSDKACWLFGTTQYLEIADNDLLDFNTGEDLTVVVVARQFGSPSYQSLIAKKAGGGALQGWYLISDNTSGGRRYLEVSDGVSGPVSGVTGITFGTLQVITGTRSGANITVYANNSAGGAAAAALDLRNTLTMRIGMCPTGNNPADAEIYAAYIFRKNLTAAQIAAAVQYWNAA